MRFRFLEPHRDVASAEQVRALRQRRGWTLEEMADEVQVSALEVAAWEAGTVRVPAKQALLIHWTEDVDAWRAALDAALSHSCGWVREHAPDLYEQIFRDSLLPTDEMHAHVDGCAACEAECERARQVGPCPDRPDTSGSLFARYRHWVTRLPRWARAPFDMAGNAVEFTFGIGIIFVFLVPDWWVGFLLWFATFMLASNAFERVLPWRVAVSLSMMAGLVAGLLGWSMFPGNSLADPLPWAYAATLVVVGEVTMLVSAAKDRKAKALAAKRVPQTSLPSPSPELAAAHQSGDAVSAVPSTRLASGVHGGDLDAIRNVVEAGRYEN